MRRHASFAIVLVVAALSLAPLAQGAETEWHSEQPSSATLGIPAPLGSVGGMAFWGPNKGVLIAGGNGAMPAGVYAYDGNGWYPYSTVCGGEEGDIAISGPDEFWTISNYAEAQEGTQGNSSGESARTLCHFANGEVTASYAEPASSAQAYPRMKAVACASAADCWFAGVELREAPNEDPFHLHWNGTGLTEVPSRFLTEGEVTPIPGWGSDLAYAQGRLIESGTSAPYLREVTLADSRRFLPFETPMSATGPFVLGGEPYEQAVWAASSNGHILALGPTGFEELPTGGPLTWTSGPTGAMGLEPGGGAAWIGAQNTISAEIRRVAGDGTVGPIVTLPQPSEELNLKGAATQIVCPGLGQCWLVTNKGWLFHLGGPPAEGPNTDPLMHRLITVRPRDASSRSFVEAGLPLDDSGEVESKAEVPIAREKFPTPLKHPALVAKVKQKMIGKTTLQLAFTLHAKAHVQLLAKHHQAVVAKTKRLTLDKGRHRLRLHLDPKHWPTGLDFEVHAVEKKASK